jgi:hypothetical protein
MLCINDLLYEVNYPVFSSFKRHFFNIFKLIDFDV